MVNESRPPPGWLLGWAPSYHTWVLLPPPPSKKGQEEQVLLRLPSWRMPVALSRASLLEGHSWAWGL